MCSLFAHLTVSFMTFVIISASVSTTVGSEKAPRNMLFVPKIEAHSYYELGYRQGKIFLLHYRNLLSVCKFVFGGITKDVKRIVQRHKKILEERYPGFLERIKGLADSLNETEDVLIAYELFLSCIPSACTITGVTRNVTKDNQRYLSWNLDLPLVYKPLFSRYFRPPPIVICELEGKYRYVEVSVLPSIFGFGLLNEKGLTCVYAMVISNDKGEGLTPLELNHLAMETCSNVDEVKMIFEKNERESGLISPLTAFGLTATLSSIWSDSSGRLMLVEYNHSTVTFIHSRILAETNHYQFLIKERFLDRLLVGSRLRLERAYQLLENNAGDIDERFYMNVLCRDHGNLFKYFGDGFDICRHGPLFMTVCCIIMKPDSYQMFYCPGHPCRFKFRVIDLREIVESF